MATWYNDLLCRRLEPRVSLEFVDPGGLAIYRERSQRNASQDVRGVTLFLGIVNHVFSSILPIDLVTV